MNKLTPDQIDYFLSRSSFSGLKILYVSYCAYKTKKAFKIKDLNKVLSSFSDEYSYGFYIACISIGFIEHESNKDIFNITKIDSYLFETIESFIKNTAKEYDLTRDADWVSKLSRSKDIQEIENYFEYIPSK